jgi:hypothetical protein
MWCDSHSLLISCIRRLAMRPIFIPVLDYCIVLLLVLGGMIRRVRSLASGNTFVAYKRRGRIYKPPWQGHVGSVAGTSVSW